MLKEAVEALVLMLSPFAPHMAEELWELLGHPGGVDAAGWPQYQEAVARAAEIVVPVQVNGKVRARLTVRRRHRATTSCGRRRWRIRRSGGTLEGKTVRKVVVAGGEAARQHRGVLMIDEIAVTCRARLVVAALALPGCGYSLAGRGSFLPAYIKMIGVPLFTNTTSLYEVEQRVTDGPRRADRPRPLDGQPRRRGSRTPCSTGEITARHARPGRFNEQQQATAYRADARRASRAARRQGEQGDLGQPGMQFSEQYDVSTASERRTDRERLPRQDANALDRLATEFARAVVSAMLEAF